jgi:uncharacterized protein DUF1629
MYYKWTVSDDYADSYWFEYDKKESPDHLIFKQGKFIDRLEGKPKFKLNKKVSLKKLLAFDCFMSDGPQFVSPRFAGLLSSIAPNDVQLFDAEVYVGDTRLEGYKVPNITHLAPCLDKEKSDYEPLLSYMPDGPIRINKIVYIPDCMGSHVIARLLEDNLTIIVQEVVVRACEKEKIKGVAFV